jgi:squalene-hopene/tetraprenyl-beta-curcumene cyclase
MVRSFVACCIICETLAATALASSSASQASGPASRVSSQPALSPAAAAMARADIDAGVAWLLKAQNADGGWGKPKSHPAFTAMAVKVLMQHGRYGPKAPEVAKAYVFLLSCAQKDGGIYDPAFGAANYTTSLAVMALALSNDPAHRAAADKAVAYLKGLQIKEGDQTPAGQTVTSEHPFYGGTSYGDHGRPDLSNLSFSIEALHAAGVSKEDPFFQRTAVFLSRTQNRSESNDQAWAAVINDGGFTYAPRGPAADSGPESKGGMVEVDGKQGPRSYGSMTYAGFLSMLYSNVSPQDPRVQAAFQWIRRYWRLDSNPNMPLAQSKEGLFYYYQVFAKALRANGQAVITDTRGIKHVWREELIEVLHEQRRDDGSWINAKDRWMENTPELVTCYSLLALQECTKQQ